MYNFNGKSDFLFFLFQQGGPADGTMTARIVRNVTPNQIQAVVQEFQETAYMHSKQGDVYYDVQGCIQLSREQVAFRDANIMSPTKFMLVWGSDHIMYLHECPEYVPSLVNPMERAAEQALEDQLDQERAEGEGMYLDTDAIALLEQG